MHFITNTIYGEYIMREVLEDWNGEVSIGGRKINNLRYADDTLIIAAKKEEMVDIMDKLSSVSRGYGLNLNKQKTKTMIVDRQNHNQPHIRGIVSRWLSRLITSAPLSQIREVAKWKSKEGSP